MSYLDKHDVVLEGHTCSYCGSISPLDAIKLLRTPGTRFEGADQKYGWPHKFYINSRKLYTVHLGHLSDEKLKEFSELSIDCFGVRWERDEHGIKYAQPKSDSFYGHQWWGIIDKDGKPDHSSMGRDI